MIHIDKNYYIDADENQFILLRTVKRKDKKTGEMKDGTDYLSYHATVSQAVRAYLRMQERTVAHQDDMELSEALSAYEKAVNRLQKLIDQHTEVK